MKILQTRSRIDLSEYRATSDLTAVQMLLGHESVGTTQMYLHPSLDDLDRKLAVVEAGWSEALAERRLEGLRS